MEQRNRTHFQNFMAKLENFREEEIQVLEEYLEPVFEVREKIVSSFSNEKASSRFSEAYTASTHAWSRATGSADAKIPMSPISGSWGWASQSQSTDRRLATLMYTIFSRPI